MRRRTYSGYRSQPRRRSQQVATLVFGPDGIPNSMIFRPSVKRNPAKYNRNKYILQNYLYKSSSRPGPRLP